MATAMAIACGRACTAPIGTVHPIVAGTPANEPAVAIRPAHQRPRAAIASNRISAERACWM